MANTMSDHPGEDTASDMSANDSRHGTRNGYNNHGCRCPACTKANTDYLREQSWRSGRRRPWAEYQATRSVTHGIRATYSHGCRCAPCREAERAYRAAYRQRKAS